MQNFLSGLVAWLEDRTGLPSALNQLLLKDIPASAGWPEVFGGVALFLFFIQALTGALLALNYAPTPGDAYRSIVYILQSVAAGRMIRGLHHWGASLMIIVVVLHMAQVFIYGAFRKPREATWIVGVCLLLFTLAFGLTGYLLPWDNRAYWGTVVTTQIVGTLPFIGTYLTRLLGATGGIGVLTFSRFYAAHTMLLPATMLFLVLVHLKLVLRHGVTSHSGRISQPQKFFPRQAFRDVMAVFITFILLFAAALFLEVPLERLADPTDLSYVPRPEWYFLFLFELLRRFQGPLEPVATFVLPSLAALALLALPFMRSRRLEIFNRRAVTVSLVLLAVAVWGGLTVTATLNTPKNSKPAFVSSEALEWARLQPEQIAGIGYFRSSKCESCHNLVSGNPKVGPNLGLSPTHRPHEWLIQHFANAGTTGSRNERPEKPLTVPELNALLIMLTDETAESARTLETVSPEFIQGAQLYTLNACVSCHKVNGSGGGVGPSLNGLASRRSKEWVERHFIHPQDLSPGSIMPPFHFTQAELAAIELYLFSLSQ